MQMTGIMVLIYFTVSYSQNLRTKFQGNLILESPNSSNLVHLLRTIVHDYLEGCTLHIIYDPSYERVHPIDFQRYFTDVEVAFTQERLDLQSAGLDPGPRQYDRCTNYLIFLDTVATVKHVLAQDIQSKIIIVSRESSWKIKDFLKSPVSRFYMHLLVITRSSSQKNSDDSYLLYTHKLYADGSGRTEPLFLSSWINNHFSGKGVNLFPVKLKDGFMGHRLVVSVIDNPPFTIQQSSIGSSDSSWDGIEVRLLRLSTSFLNLTIEFTEVRSTILSPIDTAKSDVSLGTSSAAIGGIYGTMDLNEMFDMTTPHAEDCASFISLASTALPKYRAILGPFQLNVWLLLCIAYFVLIVPLTFNSHYSLASLIKHPSGLNNMFWFVFSTYTNSFLVKNPLLNYGIARNSITLLLGIYWVFTIIITACYTGSIVAFITLPVYPSALETAEELAAYRYRIGTLNHNGWEQWFNVNHTDDPLLLQLFRKMDYVPSILEGIQNASRAYFWPYAFLSSRTSLDYFVQMDFAPTKATQRSLMHISDECFVRYNVVFLFPVKSYYKKPLSRFVILASETGMVSKIAMEVNWEVQRLAVKKKRQIIKHVSKKMRIEDRVLTVEDTQGMFLILGSGILMALLALSCESVDHFIKRRKKLKDNDSADRYPHEQIHGESWILRENAFPGLRHRSIRGSI